MQSYKDYIKSWKVGLFEEQVKPCWVTHQYSACFKYSLIIMN